MSVNLRGLIAKLNAPLRSAVEGAAGLCLSRTNYDVEIEHLLIKLLDATDTDLAVTLKHFGVNRTRFADDLARAVDRLKTGNGRTPSLSTSLVNALREGWVIGSVEYGAPRVRTGHVLLALLTVPELQRMAMDISKEFEKIPADVLKKDFATITASSTEAAAEIGSIDSVAAGASASGSGGAAPKAGGRTPNLDQYAISKCGRWWIFSHGAGRTIPSSWAKRASARRPWWRASRVASSTVMCRRRCATCVSCHSTWPCCRPVPA